MPTVLFVPFACNLRLINLSKIVGIVYNLAPAKFLGLLP